jgi:hypothetical protein
LSGGHGSFSGNDCVFVSDSPHRQAPPSA